MGVKVKQRKPGGPWWVFVNHGGKRTARSVGDKKAAQALARELQQALAAGSLGIGKPEAEEGVTFEKYVEQYLTRAEQQLKYSTWRDYGIVCRLRLVPALGPLQLAEITRRHVNDLEAKLRAEGLSDSNVSKHLRVLSSILSEAAEDELIGENPAMMRRKRRRRTSAGSAGAKHANPYNREEIERLLATAMEHTEQRREKSVAPFRAYHPLFLTLARTGLRLGEALALEWGDVDLVAGTLHVRRSLTRGRLDAPKSGKGRVVDLSAQLKATLREQYEERFGRVVALDGQAEAERRGARLEALIFPSEIGGHIDEHNLRRRVWLPLLAAAELRHSRIHDLRHGYASLLIEAGAELQYVQGQLGHHSAAFTLRVYGHLLPRDRRGYVDRLDSGDQVAPSVGRTQSAG